MPKKKNTAVPKNRRDSQAALMRAKATAQREIGPLPKRKNYKRYNRCRADLLDFCLTYFKQRFPLPFSADHLKVIQTLQRTVLEGGQFALAMPRGSGKTTLCEVAAIWAVLYGHRRFVVLVGATEAKATSMLESIKTTLECNDLLLADFPEAVHPIRALGRIAHRAAGQVLNDKPTFIEWTGQSIRIATVPKSKCSGAILQVAGITGAIRGPKKTLSSGEVIRPDLALVDDPQTDESAGSATQNQDREHVVSAAILQLAGPGKKIAAVMPMTVIYPGDFADRILDRQLSPEWQGQRYKTLNSLPTNELLWDEYNKIRVESLRADRGIADATAFYLANRERMDEGASAAWPERFDPDCVSAIQWAMNLKLSKPEVFASEYQNDPLPAHGFDDFDELTADQVAGKLSRVPRLLVPLAATRLTAFIDVHGDLLYYAVCAWDERFNGQVMDYGTWPRQQRAYFRLTDANPPLAVLYPGQASEVTIYAGLRDLTAAILDRKYGRADSDEDLKIERCLIDANWGKSTETVYQFCGQSAHSVVLLPSHGRGFTASSKPMAEWKRTAGDRAGLNWRVMPPASPRRQRHAIFDVNWWKSFIAARLQAEFGAAGCLALWGDRASDHQLFADHCTAEYRVKTSGRGRDLEEWKLPPDRPDNHWFDCLVGCAVAVSIAGLHWSADGEVSQKAKGKTKRSLRDLYDKKRQGKPVDTIGNAQL